MKRLLAMLMVGVFLIQSAPTALASPTEKTNWECSILQHGKYACDAYLRWGRKAAQTWQDYNSFAFAPEMSPLWNKSASELYTRYKQVAADIHRLWNANPRYKEAKAARFAGIVLVTGLVVSTAYVGGELVAPFLEAGGFTIAATTARIVPNTARAVRAAAKGRISAAYIKEGLRKLATRVKTGKFWGDVGLTIGVMAADGMLNQGAFYVFESLAEEQTAYLTEVKTNKVALKTRNLLQEITNVKLTPAQQEDLEKNKDDIYALKKELEDSFKAALDKQGWGGELGDAMHREAVVTLYALEFIRAEMANLNDPFRYEMAAEDFAMIFYGEQQSHMLALESDERPARRQNHKAIKEHKARQEFLEMSQTRKEVFGSWKLFLRKMKENNSKI